MPHPHFERDRPRGRDLSPSPTSSYDSDPYDRYDRPSRAVQPYTNNFSYRPRDSRAVQPYVANGYSSDTGPRRSVRRRRSDSYFSPSPPASTARKTSRRDQGVDWFKDHGAELLGAAAGGYAGRKKGSEDPLKTASGAAVGAIGGKVLDKQYRKWNDRREDKKVGRDVRGRRDDDYEVGRRGYYSRGRDGHRYDFEPRYSRSLDRGRGRSVSRERDRSPQSLMEVARQLGRSMSRKGTRT